MEEKEFQTPSWLEGLRKEFPVTEKWAYFDSAYETGGAVSLKKHPGSILLINVIFTREFPRWEDSGKGAAIDLIEETRDLLAKFLMAEMVTVLQFTANTCQAVASGIAELSL